MISLLSEKAKIVKMLFTSASKKPNLAKSQHMSSPFTLVPHNRTVKTES